MVPFSAFMADMYIILGSMPVDNAASIMFCVPVILTSECFSAVAYAVIIVAAVIVGVAVQGPPSNPVP